VSTKEGIPRKQTLQEHFSFPFVASVLEVKLQKRDFGHMPSPLLSLLFILITTIPSTYYLYNHPRIHGCAWPDPSAPFRLLALADPQIEGDKKQKSWRGIYALEVPDNRPDRYLGKRSVPATRSSTEFETDLTRSDT
jgi:hypothetical protein